VDMIQFCIVFYHNIQVLFRSCDYPKFVNGLLAFQAAYFLYLFGCFYYKQYVKGKREKVEAEEKKLQNGTVQNGIISKNKNIINEQVNIITNGVVNNIKNGKVKEQ
ncbi:hypothetical protein NQ314_014511, partial [Rhamnusium bicolor]